MIVGVPKEIKNNENRVAITPAGVQALVNNGHSVIIEQNAGVGSGITDEEYVTAGAKMLPTKEEIWGQADMVMKVKEPIAPEYPLLKEGLILFAYLHLAPEPELTQALIDKKVVAIAYETVVGPSGGLSLLTPMSEVAGRMSVQVGAYYLQKPNGGRGVMIGGVPGVAPAKVVVIGGGVVGTNAAKMSVGLGGDVTILEKSKERMIYLDDIFGNKVKTIMSNGFNIAQAVKDADLVIGAVLIPGAKAPHLVTEEMVKSMKPGAVIVDVSIDQGGCITTIDHSTTHDNPVYDVHGVVHYAVANMPGALARTSTFALTNATLDYAIALTNKGWLQAIKDDAGLAQGVNVLDGKVTFKAVADALGHQYTPLSILIS